MRAIKGDFAEYEHAKIAQRTFSKKLEKARSGEIIAGNTPNYGFRYNEKRNNYLVDEDKMPLVRRAFEMIGKEGETSYSVVRWLEGVNPHGPTGKGWNLPHLRRMVFNDAYRPHSFEEVKARVPAEVTARLDPDKRYGVWWYNRRRFEPKRTPPKTPGDFKRKYRPIDKPREEWIGVPVPDSGIPPDLVDAARTRIGKNKAPSKNGKRFWELSGNVVRCAECGYVLGVQLGNPNQQLLLLPLPLEVQREKRLHQRPGGEGRYVGAGGLEDDLFRPAAPRPLEGGSGEDDRVREGAPGYRACGANRTLG